MSAATKCLQCIEHGEPYDGPCGACGHYTAGTKPDGRRIVKHDGRTFLANLRGRHE